MSSITDAAPSIGTSIARFDHVTRRFGEVLAVDDVTLDIGEGSIVGLLGPNAAGKTTWNLSR